MNKFLLLTILCLFPTITNANIQDVLICENTDWTLIIGLNGVPDDTDTVSILVEGAEGGEGGYTASVGIGKLFEELAAGLKLDDPANNEKNVALLTVEGNKAKLVSGAGLQLLTCIEVAN